jgi:hypothetical protein
MLARAISPPRVPDPASGKIRPFVLKIVARLLKVSLRILAKAPLTWERVGWLRERRTAGSTFVGPGIIKSSRSSIIEAS